MLACCERGEKIQKSSRLGGGHVKQPLLSRRKFQVDVSVARGWWMDEEVGSSAPWNERDTLCIPCILGCYRMYLCYSCIYWADFSAVMVCPVLNECLQTKEEDGLWSVASLPNEASAQTYFGLFIQHKLQQRSTGLSTWLIQSQREIKWKRDRRAPPLNLSYHPFCPLSPSGVCAGCRPKPSPPDWGGGQFFVSLGCSNGIIKQSS